MWSYTPPGLLWEEDSGGKIKNFDGVVVDRKQRDIRCPGFLGARVRPGTIRPDLISGVGDGILLDFARGFFAVSDSSDRDTSFSRSVLIRFSGLIEDIVESITNRNAEDDVFSGIRKELEERSVTLLREFTTKGSCTFTGVFLIRVGNDVRGILLHTGDSLLMRLDLTADCARTLTEGNFWMVGRTSAFFQSAEIQFASDTMILLATDGLDGLILPEETGRDRFMLDLFRAHPVEEIPDLLMTSQGECPGGRDDLALIALHPWSFTSRDVRLVLGGTAAAEEERFRRQDGVASGN